MRVIGAGMQRAGLKQVELSSSNFLIAFQVASFVFGFTKDLSILLQGTTMNIVKAYEEVKLVTKTLEKVNEDSEEFKPLFDSESRCHFSMK